MERINQIFNIQLGEFKPIVFTQLDFWLLFLLIMFVFSILHKNNVIKSLFITVVSLFIYYKTSGLFVFFLAGSMFWNFAIGNWISKSKTIFNKKTALITGLTLNLFLLIYFKYGFFFTESYNELFKTDYKILNQFALWGNGFFGKGSFDEKLFAAGGVSFITFQSITYLVDIYRNELKPVKNIFHYTAYATFFPYILMGPISRAKDIIPQLIQPYQLNKTDFSAAVFQILKGLVKKLVLADYIAVHFIDKVLDTPEAYPGFVGIIAMWGYSLYIYGDFSGYTDIATGIARLMGIKLTKNFDSPYKAINVGDFWRRWHRSLGSWFRDYLYIPLGGNKTGGLGSYIMITIIMIFLIFITQWYDLLYVYASVTIFYLILIKRFPKFKTFVHRDLNLLITMVVGGLWHGASENYVIWGSLNGVALVLFNYWKKISPYEKSDMILIRAWKIFLTFNFITFTRIWFRLEENGKPLKFLTHLTEKFDFSIETFNKMFISFLPVMIIIICGFIIHFLPSKWKESIEIKFSKTHFSLQILIVVLLVISVYQAVSDISKPFVYLQY
jgi:alginate O-acetyltransferase complex protein AlgI